MQHDVSVLKGFAQAWFYIYFVLGLRFSRLLFKFGNTSFGGMQHEPF